MDRFQKRWEKVYKYFPYLRRLREAAEQIYNIEIDTCIRWDRWRFDKTRPAVGISTPAAITSWSDKANTYKIEFDPEVIRYNNPHIKCLFLHEIGHIAMGHIGIPGRENPSPQDSKKPWDQQRIEKEAECFVIARVGLAYWQEHAEDYGYPKGWAEAVVRKYLKDPERWALHRPKK